MTTSGMCERWPSDTTKNLAALGSLTVQRLLKALFDAEAMRNASTSTAGSSTQMTESQQDTSQLRSSGISTHSATSLHKRCGTSCQSTEELEPLSCLLKS